ncbi:unnamed protein product [Moneuplotes crassus]|uniref:DNA primase large subunit C-terminal domain-containing protein n=1 Tax=Euplotes crassus TaxID=5936 RepID=A0AAD1UHD3_EUPCR|nr:unnamed protein product [Moneuplotes crassus]
MEEESKLQIPYIPFYEELTFLKKFCGFDKSTPSKIINLDELETLCFKRVACLKLVEMESEVGDEFEKIHQKLLSKLAKQDIDLKLYDGNPEHKKSIDNDIIAHFMLRLAYCRNDDFRRWLSVQETRLFKHVLFAHTSKNELLLKNLLEEKNIKYDQVPVDEWEALKYKIAWDKISYSDKETLERKSAELKATVNETEKEQLLLDIKNIRSKQNSLRTQYCRFSFTSALALVGTRRCFVHQGNIYLHISQLFTIISEEFRNELKEALIYSNRHLPLIAKDQRLAELLKYVSRKELLDFEYDEKSNVRGSVNLANIDTFARSAHYPPCMKVLHSKLTDNHHLRHFGRLQYGLFIKGIGLNLEESMSFWKRKFAGKINGEKFDKEYAYNVRHSFGKEGKRTDYTPWSCSKIISQIPGSGEYHGCPFKYFKDETLSDFLTKKYDIQSRNLLEIMEKKREGAAQVACIKLWDATHKIDTKDNVGNHPNAYFSCSLQSAEEAKSKGLTK